MTFWEHLEELRRRLIVIAIAIGTFSILSLSFGRPIEAILRFPMETSISNILAAIIDRTVGVEGSMMGFLSVSLKAGASNVEAELLKIGPVEGIKAYLKISITSGFLLASPIVLYQIWAFIFPALTRKERRYALPLFFVIVVFFVIGVVFAYLIVTPTVLHFADSLFPTAKDMWDIEKYVNFMTGLLLGFGIAFELPIVMAFLSWIGVVDSRGFRAKQSYAAVGIFVMSALLTPADPLSMFLMAVPLIVLYQLGIFFAFLLERESESHA
ncbi:MAG: twin-arginine translocase subunit TatC [Candidatus Poribacteria bacterium]|nr:twin-arginine translocase subunit TatC [Candidatus Poribacteria bacterium]MDE0504766.1 twin-arginine translocase subunit TatC [Candidatus Poribacteria bacterium]